MMTNTNIFFLFTVIIFILSSCENDTSNNYIALVDVIPVTQYEFTMRYNFNPHLVQYYNENDAKRALLSALIAEKLLSLEASSASQVTEDVEIRIEQHKKEAIIEQYRRDHIENKIDVTDFELKNEYNNALKEVDIKYIAFKSLEDAKKIKQEIVKGVSFENAVRDYMKRRGWEDDAIPEKTVKWSTEFYDLEKFIFALDSGEISNPIEINGDYYLIKSEENRVNKNQNNTDYLNRLPALKDRVLKHKIKNRYVEFYNSNIRSLLGNIEWKKLNDAFELITQEISFDQKPTQSHPFADDKALSEEIYLNYETLKSQLTEMIIIHFPNHSTWTLEDLMRDLKYGPFSFNYKNKTLFKKSFKQNVMLALEYEAIYQLAKQAGYQNDEHVLKDTKIWESYYQANDYRYQLLKTAESGAFLDDSSKYKVNAQLSGLQKFRLEYLDDYLCSLSKKYSIKINLKKFNTIKLNKSDIVVMKTHYAHRLVVPLTEPLTGLPQWQNTMQSILRKSDII